MKHKQSILLIVLVIVTVILLLLLFTKSDQGSIITQMYDNNNDKASEETAADTAENKDVFTTEKNEALSVAEKYLSELQKQNYEGVMGLYHNRWFENMSKLETVDFLKNMDDKVGSVGTYVLDSWESKRYAEEVGGRSGFYATLIFTTKRSKFDAKETMILFRGDDEKEYLILSHNIDSKAFEQ